MDTGQASITEESVSTDAPPARKRYARIAPLYKALIWTSFALNVVLIIIVGVLVGLIVIYRQNITTAVGSVQSFAGNNVSELQDVVEKLQGARIVHTVPLDTRIPIQIDVPINQATVVTLTESIPLNVPAGIFFPAGGGNLNATVNIQLPAGLRLPIALNFAVPLDTSIPVQLEVPVDIPLIDTELGPQFQRLGAVVDRLVEPAEPLLIRPAVPPDSSKPLSSPEQQADLSATDTPGITEVPTEP